ncbi:MAG: hypothetical protein KHX03_08320 [Clostridium sp.]|nr:hypothetical protein [Clostridium sp.]
MNEVRIANYTLLITLLLIMGVFYTSIQSLSQTNKNYGEYPSIISGYRY